MGTVFISYSHKDEAWKERVVKHLDVLKMQGNIDAWDDRRIKAGEKWFQEIEKTLKEADAAVLLISPDFLTSAFILNQEVPALLRKSADEGMKIFPLIVKPCAWQETQWLKKLQARPKDGKPLSGFNKHKAETIMSAFTVEIKNILNKKESPQPVIADHDKPAKRPKVSLSRLPVTGKELFGRETELTLLDDAWAEDGTHIVTLTAWGGVGKSALVNRWLNKMAGNNYCGCGDRVRRSCAGYVTDVGFV